MPTLVQSGYVVSLVSSHAVKMSYRQKGVEGAKSEEMLLISGMNTFCVPKAGSYEISLSGCHRYGADVPKSFATSNVAPVSISALSHRHTVKILADEKDTYKTQVTSKAGND